MNYLFKKKKTKNNTYAANERGAIHPEVLEQ